MNRIHIIGGASKRLKTVQPSGRCPQDGILSPLLFSVFINLNFLYFIILTVGMRMFYKFMCRPSFIVGRCDTDNEEMKRNFGIGINLTKCEGTVVGNPIPCLGWPRVLWRLSLVMVNPLYDVRGCVTC